MEESFYDKAMTKAVDIMGKVSDKIAGDLKSTKPFNQERVSFDKILGAYQRLTPLQKQAFVAQYPSAMLWFQEFDKRLIGGNYA